jgi:ATP-dependent DNA helicase RecG
MSPAESQTYDKKSLRLVTGKTAAWGELATDTVAFSNARGGMIVIGIEDGDTEPPLGQVIHSSLSDTVRKRIGELTVNTEAIPVIQQAANGGQYLELHIPRSHSVASTTDGRYFLRVGDHSRPILGDEVLRLINDRGSMNWEILTALQVPRTQVDQAKVDSIFQRLRSSDRVKDSVKAKADDELLDHYLLADGPFLTNLGVMCIGRRVDRTHLGTAPVIQALKYDERRERVAKWLWDDYELSPVELVDAVWAGVPEFREHYEIREGMFPQPIPMFDEVVVRELLVNALVHRPYTQRGDIFLNFHPDRMEVVNPGLLPIGVTPGNMLHKSVRRNDHLARLFHDLKLMEREGTGFDTMYAVLLAQGRPAPVVVEGSDSVHVTVRRQILKPELVGFMAKADGAFQLSQREKITLGLLAMSDGLTALELAAKLELRSVEELKPWLGRLQGLKLVESQGRTKGTRYFVPPAILRSMEIQAPTTLSRIQPHRLRELLLEDLKRYPDSAIGEIHVRIGLEIPRAQVKDMLLLLTQEGKVRTEGEKRGRRYGIVR